MRHRRKKGLLRKYVTTVFIILIVDFLAMTIAATVTTGIFISRYIDDNVYVQQERAGEALDQVVYRTLSTYAKMFTATSINALLDEATTDKEAFYQTMYQSAIVSENLFGGNATMIGDDYYSSDSNLMIIRSADVEAVYLSERWIEYVTTYVDSENQYVVFGKKIANPSSPLLTVGVTFFYLRHDVFSNIITAISGEQGYSFIVSNQSQIIAHQNPTYAGAMLLSQTEFGLDQSTHYQLKSMDSVFSLITVKSLPQIESAYHFSWQIVTVEPFAAIFSSLTNLQWIISLIALVILVISLMVAIFVATKIVSPINRLSQKLAQYNPLEPKVIDPQGEISSELYQLEKRYDDMVERIYELLKKNKDDAEYQRKLELDSLQMQINPHFLYNTLDAIAWMAKIKKEAEIEHLVLALARFFRLSLHKGDKFITVEEEIELIKHFVAIELVRFPEKFSIYYDIDDKVKHFQMLKLVIQPIVENAIKHGISSLSRMGKITISARLVEHDIVIEVSDDGVGFNPPNDLLEKNPSKQRQLGGYGLINVNDRIKLEYGPNYGITVDSAMDQGTKVTIRLAARI